jgi:uncharacterized phage-associated protein
MKPARDFAKYFARNGLPDSFDGNMTLQKHLLFADLIHIATCGIPLFDDEILAFENGCVVESIRQEFHQRHFSFTDESKKSNFNFTPEEQKTLSYTENIFGNVSARELSELNHEFVFWDNAYRASVDGSGYKSKEKAVVSLADMKAEAHRLKPVIDCYERNIKENHSREVVNGITFFYDPKEVCLRDIFDHIYKFSLSPELDETSYFVGKIEGETIIY